MPYCKNCGTKLSGEDRRACDADLDEEKEIMQHHVYYVLGVGYPHEEYKMTAVEWIGYGIEFDHVDDIKQAATMIAYKEYVCVSICADVIPQDDLDALRQVRPVPIVVVPPSYTEAQSL